VISGLPYTINAAFPTNGSNGGPLYSTNLTFASGMCIIGYLPGTATLNFLNVASGSLAALTNTAFANTTEVAGSMFYID
jgi:hypothetical protein